MEKIYSAAKSFVYEVFLRISLVLTIWGVHLSAQAVTFDVDGIRYEILSKTEKTVEVAIIPKSIAYPSYSLYSGNYTIPETVEFKDITYHVVGIGTHAFSECYNLGNIALPRTLQYIGFGAFSRSNISSLVIPEGVDSIGSAAFYGCNYLEKIVLPKSITKLGENIFYDCTKLQSLKILSDKLTYIPNDFCLKCQGLTDILIPTSIQTIGESAFRETKSLNSLVIPQNVKSIGNFCFYSSGLASIEMYDNVVSIGNKAFRECDKLQYVKLSSNIEELENEMFRECSMLETVILPEKITTIPEYCFFGCSSLKNISIPASVIALEKFAFAHCVSLEYIKESAILSPIYRESYRFRRCTSASWQTPISR